MLMSHSISNLSIGNPLTIDLIYLRNVYKIYALTLLLSFIGEYCRKLKLQRKVLTTKSSSIYDSNHDEKESSSADIGTMIVAPLPKLAIGISKGIVRADEEDSKKKSALTKFSSFKKDKVENAASSHSSSNDNVSAEVFPIQAPLRSTTHEGECSITSSPCTSDNIKKVLPPLGEEQKQSCDVAATTPSIEDNQGKTFHYSFANGPNQDEPQFFVPLELVPQTGRTVVGKELSSQDVSQLSNTSGTNQDQSEEQKASIPLSTILGKNHSEKNQSKSGQHERVIALQSSTSKMSKPSVSFQDCSAPVTRNPSTVTTEHVSTMIQPVMESVKGKETLCELVSSGMFLPQSVKKNIVIARYLHKSQKSGKERQSCSEKGKENHLESVPPPPPPQLKLSPKLSGQVTKAGTILYSDCEYFTEGSLLPVPSQEAMDRNIGQGGNGTITIIYYKEQEFAVKKTHYRQMEVEIMSKVRHRNILSMMAVMMGEEDPKRSKRFYCYHFLPKMTFDLQSCLTKVGHGGVSALLLKYKDEPVMLQLVVDNVKHILSGLLSGLAHLHDNNIVHNDVKPSNILLNMHCLCDSPFLCTHNQNFDIKIGDFDSAIDLPRLLTNPNLAGQLQRNNPIGTPGYRALEFILIATRTKSDLSDYDKLTASDIWSVGATVLKIFLSHSGPHTQREMAAIHLCELDYYPWNKQKTLVKKIKKLTLLQSVYPNWTQLWQFVGDCFQAQPRLRPNCQQLLKHDFFDS